MIKVDYKKELKHLYAPSLKDISVVQVPAMNFLTVEGRGNPNSSQEFQDATEALFGVSYMLKFSAKNDKTSTDYSVMPLEGLWWSDNMEDFTINNKDGWQWLLMIMQPGWITAEAAAQAIEAVNKKKKTAHASKIRFTNFEEGLSVQIMYKGPYADEAPTISNLHRYIQEHGYERCGKHHEIYLSDSRKSAPENMKTILRQPMKKSASC